jgi:hypothetical protein
MASPGPVFIWVFGACYSSLLFLVGLFCIILFVLIFGSSFGALEYSIAWW